MKTLLKAAFFASLMWLMTSRCQAQGIYYAITGVPAGDVLNVRAGPGQSYTIVARLDPSTKNIEVHGTPTWNGTDDWVRIRVGIITGWTRPKHLRLVSADSGGAGGSVPPKHGGGHAPAHRAHYRVIGVAAGDVLNLRAGPGQGYSIVARLTPDTGNIEVLSEPTWNGSDDWVKVRAGTTLGWTRPKHLQRMNP